jgi:hypothetical protein
MTLTIELTPEEEARLQAAAREQGLEPAECAHRLLTEHLPAVDPEDRTLELFAAWDAEDATDDPEEIQRRNREWEELKAQMNETRTQLGMEPLFP